MDLLGDAAAFQHQGEEGIGSDYLLGIVKAESLVLNFVVDIFLVGIEGDQAFGDTLVNEFVHVLVHSTHSIALLQACVVFNCLSMLFQPGGRGYAGHTLFRARQHFTIQGDQRQRALCRQRHINRIGSTQTLLCRRGRGCCREIVG